MKNIEVKYNENGKITNVSDNSLHFEQENESLCIKAQLTVDDDKSVRAYIKGPNNNSDVTDAITKDGEYYSLVIRNEYMSKGTLYIGFEVFNESGYIERYEPLKVYIDGFVNPGNGSSDNVYVVTVDVAEVETLEPDTPAYVENVGTQKDMRLKIGIPQGKKGESGDKGEKGDTGEPGVQGEPGYTPVKGEDYYTPEERETFKAEVIGEVENLTFDYYYTLATMVENYNNYTQPGMYKIKHVTDSAKRTNILIVTQLPTAKICSQLKITNASNIQKRQGNLLEDGTADNWGEWVAYATKADVNDAKAYTDEKLGDIETALDTIIAMQNELTGGEGA